MPEVYPVIGPVDIKLKHQLVLEFWNIGFSAPIICELLDYGSEQSVSGIIASARKRGDARAVARFTAGGRRTGPRAGAGREAP